jgi:hypothetical protein
LENKSSPSIQSLLSKNTNIEQKLFERTPDHLHFAVEPSAEDSMMP